MNNRGRNPFLLLVSFILLTPPVIHAAEPVEFNRGDHHIDVLIGGKPFATFYFDPKVPKPYLHPLRSAQGIVVTRGYPMRKDIPGESTDHPHHRAMFFAHGDVNGIDFWSEAEFEKAGEGLPKGRTVFRKLEELQGGSDSGRLRAVFDLLGPDGKAIAQLVHTYVFQGDDQSRVIDCEFTVRAFHTSVKMGDTKEGTFAIRVVKALEEPAGRMINSKRAVGEKQIWGKRANWVDYSGVVEGKKVGIAIFDHPSNPKHPTYWHARGYGLFAVNSFGEHDFLNDKTRDGSISVPAGGSLTFWYRVLIHKGDASEAKVSQAYELYAAAR